MYAFCCRTAFLRAIVAACCIEKVPSARGTQPVQPSCVSLAWTALPCVLSQGEWCTCSCPAGPDDQHGASYSTRYACAKTIFACRLADHVGVKLMPIWLGETLLVSNQPAVVEPLEEPVTCILRGVGLAWRLVWYCALWYRDTLGRVKRQEHRLRCRATRWSRALPHTRGAFGCFSALLGGVF